MAISLFGFTISRDQNEDPANRTQSFVTPTPDDGASTVQAGGYFGTYVDLDATAKSESELITKYREASQYPDCSTAIDEIVSEAIAAVDDENPVDINLDEVELDDKIKKTISIEFKQILKLLEFNNKGFDIFRRWYVDGRIYYQKVIDIKAPKRGILELRQIDPRKIRKVRNIQKEKLQNGVEVIKNIEEFFIYNEKGLQVNANFGANPSNPNQGIKIAPDSISYTPSGLLDLEKNVVLSYLHKAIKPVNQLKMMEDALVIYRLSRAPERRIFYIDVGNLPKIKAEQYMKDIMARYRNKIIYDSSTGEIRDDRKVMSMLEDFWLPRREGGKGTEITTLPGGENLGQIEDINYFQNKLYQSLNVPTSRMQAQTGLNFGRVAEITRDELKFAKFVARLRKKFNDLFNDLLRTQLILKGIITQADWDTLQEKLQYQYAQDQYFQELKEAETMRNRIDLLNQVQPYVGFYFSKQYVQRKILRMSDEDIEDMNEEISVEPTMPNQEDAVPVPTAGATQAASQENRPNAPINN
ncbi:MAG: portal protein [Actinobacteria bacterium]|jgi:Bacteriophage T4-like portal protein (Gp20)|nr:portal protein [Actinomycetota bacterium]NDA77831.1 portal protein [Actinomycetota bacterium]NDE80764.1 portal protein [Actinomycetota bacterium]